ncbi:MAG: GntR family transcriptional regulator [Planctomycetota bacterium]
MESLVAVSTTDLAYEEILKRIVRGDLAEGSPIKGSCIAEELGVSRTPVVQAIARLVAEGVLHQELNHRAIVAQGAGSWFHNVHEVRLLLEPAAARAASGNLPKSILEELYKLSEAFDPEHGLEALREFAFQFDHALHSSIAHSSGNLLLCSIIQKCMSFKRFAYRVPNDPLDRLTRSHQEHLEILRAIESGDAETAAAAMLFHLRSTSRELPDKKVI